MGVRIPVDTLHVVVEEVPVHQVAGGRVNRMGCLLGADAGGGENDMEEADGRRWGD